MGEPCIKAKIVLLSKSPAIKDILLPARAIIPLCRISSHTAGRAAVTIKKSTSLPKLSTTIFAPVYSYPVLYTSVTKRFATGINPASNRQAIGSVIAICPPLTLRLKPIPSNTLKLLTFQYARGERIIVASLISVIIMIPAVEAVKSENLFVTASRPSCVEVSTLSISAMRIYATTIKMSCSINCRIYCTINIALAS